MFLNNDTSFIMSFLSTESKLECSTEISCISLYETFWNCADHHIANMFHNGMSSDEWHICNWDIKHIVFVLCRPNNQSANHKDKPQRQRENIILFYHPLSWWRWLTRQVERAFMYLLCSLLLRGILCVRRFTGNWEGSYMDQTGEMDSHPK